MDNKLIKFILKWLSDNEKTTRDLSKKLGFSLSYISYVLNQKRPVTWAFAASVAEADMGIDHVTAFRMAGLLPENDNGIGEDSADAVVIEKVTVNSVPQKPAVVTKGNAS